MDAPVTRNEFEAQNESVRANTDALNALNQKIDVIIQKLKDIEAHSSVLTFRKSGDEGSFHADIEEKQPGHGQDMITMEEILQKDCKG